MQATFFFAAVKSCTTSGNFALNALTEIGQRKFEIRLDSSSTLKPNSRSHHKPLDWKMLIENTNFE